MDEETLVARANEEREKLFQRYDHGREPGAEIDSWEDPGFEVYHQTDRYGFIHDKRLPQKFDPNEQKAQAIEMERVKKWLKMLKRWDSKETHDKLKSRVYKGIPDKLRSRVWIKLLNLEQIMSDNKNVYQRMLKLARQWSTEARQIDSDVNRQFREHLFYRERYNLKQKSLFNVLTAYSMYNMEVGYCQGMSGLAGVLLMYMDEEEAFWALSTLLSDKKYAMHGLYIEGFPKLTRFLAHHDKIIGKFIPRLKKHFDQYNLDSILYSLKWFFVIFVERIPFNLCLRVWDIYLLDGERVVTAMAYTILKLNKRKILKLKDMDLIVQFLQVKLHKDFGFDDDHVIKALESSMDELRKAKLDLPPPGGENEFPKRPFGVFTEPTFEAKIGRRKSIFTETEKEVTDTVILRREMTAQDLAESRLLNGVDGSNAQLNTAGNVPESEDGCSLLGSSRKSLADTSVTSTADLSIFSGGQRSQQAYDVCVDDVRSIQSEGEGESSPGSAFCSLSVVGRTPSAMMITPTPRAMSPQDIVRIYVPPAPPEEFSSTEQKNEISKTINKDNLIKSANGSKTNSIISGGSDENGETTPLRNSLYKSEEELVIINESLNNGLSSTKSSSSRRGSMSRKSPSVYDNEILECSHTRNRKNSVTDNSNKIKLNVSVGEYSNPTDDNWDKLGASPSRKMTSFEELAKIKMNNERMAKSEPYNYNDDDDIRSTSYYSTYSSRNGARNNSKDCTIQYKTLSSSLGSDNEYSHPTHNKRIRQRQGSGSGNDSSPIEYDVVITKPKDKYNRLYNKNGKSLDDEETDDDDHCIINKSLNKSSDDSSSSPNSKSVLTTPVNETIPLLMSPDKTINFHNNFIINSSVAQNEMKTFIDESGPESFDSYIKNNKVLDNRIAAPIGGPYEFTSSSTVLMSSSSSSPSNRNNIETNKIRIKINHNHSNEQENKI